MVLGRFAGLGVLVVLGVGNGMLVEKLAMWNLFLRNSGVTGWRLM